MGTEASPSSLKLRRDKRFSAMPVGAASECFFMNESRNKIKMAASECFL
jgi:hypothetical protein